MITSVDLLLLIVAMHIPNYDYYEAPECNN